MRELTEEERLFFERIKCSYLDKRNGYYYYNLRKKHYKRSRILLQLHLNKRLELWELVHHKNGDRTDDRLENLEVKDHSEHAYCHYPRTQKVRTANKNKVISA